MTPVTPDQQASQPSPEWKQFEEAIASFIQQHAPSARVTHSADTPDRDTGVLRERDVWIETMVANLFSITIHISCKNYQRKLNQLDIDTFIGELRSSQANLGVIYSLMGFAPQAIAKCKAVGIQCCRFYNDQPADVPQLVPIAAYYWVPVLQIRGAGTPEHLGTLTWKDLIHVQDDDGTLIEQIDSACRLIAADAKKAVSNKQLLPDIQRSLTLTFAATTDRPGFLVTLTHRWRIYRARDEAHTAHGSYSEIDKRFTGSIHTPSIDTWSDNPGDGWVEVAPDPRTFDLAAIHLIGTRDIDTASLEASLSTMRVLAPTDHPAAGEPGS